MRPFLSLLGAAPAGRRILKAVRCLPAFSRRRAKDRPLLPREVDAELVPAMWRRAVFSNAKLPQGAVDRDAHVVCVLEQLHRALNRRDVFASPSNEDRRSVPTSNRLSEHDRALPGLRVPTSACRQEGPGLRSGPSA
ncbi:hypothetical protein FMEAI12_4020081 [Parafrankia sp. Ea1.12]|nr:hypothetical protein FMEAI12_4020081 [Parafrankia sp. Ea1.12]